MMPGCCTPATRAGYAFPKATAVGRNDDAAPGEWTRLLWFVLERIGQPRIALANGALSERVHDTKRLLVLEIDAATCQCGTTGAHGVAVGDLSDDLAGERRRDTEVDAERRQRRVQARTGLAASAVCSPWTGPSAQVWSGLR